MIMAFGEILKCLREDKDLKQEDNRRLQWDVSFSCPSFQSVYRSIFLFCL